MKNVKGKMTRLENTLMLATDHLRIINKRVHDDLKGNLDSSGEEHFAMVKEREYMVGYTNALKEALSWLSED